MDAMSTTCIIFSNDRAVGLKNYVTEKIGLDHQNGPCCHVGLLPDT